LEFDLRKPEKFQIKTMHARLPSLFDWIILNPPWMAASKLPGESVIVDGVYDKDFLML
jgi:hypothetical protein